MEETYIINNVKEACCYVSQDAMVDLNTCRRSSNPIVQEFVLPDFSTTTHGHVRSPGKKKNDDEQILVMNNERFMIPESLMHPSDIGMDQAGIPETIVQAIHACDPGKQTPPTVSVWHSFSFFRLTDLHGLLYANIVLVGGNAKFPGYQQRM